MVFSKPLNVGYPAFIFNYLKCEVGSDLAEVVFYGSENALLLIVGVVSNE